MYLTSITLPDSVIWIDNGAFAGDTHLAYATIGSGVYYIGQAAFRGCGGLSAITFEGTIPPSIDTGENHGVGNASLGSTSYTFPIYVPSESVEAYKTAFGQYYAPRIQAIQ